MLSAWRAIRQKPQTAPSRAFSPWSATKFARRSTASSAWPICCSTRRSLPDQLTYARAAKTSGETLLSLIEEILDFSKIEAGKLDLEARPFALTTMVEEAIELMAPRAQAKGIEIASFVDEHLPPQVVGDAARLRQVLLNLVGNAVKFTDKGGVAVVVEPGNAANEIRFEVRDTGIGLKTEDLARIFLDFEQADGSSKRRFGGTGLGLAISRRIVERMDGHITVDEQAGRGLDFRRQRAFAAGAGRTNPRASLPPTWARRR